MIDSSKPFGFYYTSPPQTPNQVTNHASEPREQDLSDAYDRSSSRVNLGAAFITAATLLASQAPQAAHAAQQVEVSSHEVLSPQNMEVTANDIRLGVEEDRTALQKQVDFFDTNNDRKISLVETYNGMRSIGVGKGKAVLVSLITNGAFGYASGSPWHSPLTVSTETIHKAKHGGDTDSYDNNGAFDSEKFEAIFQHDTNKDGALSETEIQNMLEAQKDGDKFGALASKSGFGLLMEVGGEQKGEERVLTRETLQEFYDGTLFYRLSGRVSPH